MSWSVVPAEEHDDAPADDVEPRPLLPHHLAQPSSSLLLLHLSLSLKQPREREYGERVGT